MVVVGCGAGSGPAQLPQHTPVRRDKETDHPTKKGAGRRDLIHRNSLWVKLACGNGASSKRSSWDEGCEMKLQQGRRQDYFERLRRCEARVCTRRCRGDGNVFLLRIASVSDPRVKIKIFMFSPT